MRKTAAHWRATACSASNTKTFAVYIITCQIADYSCFILENGMELSYSDFVTVKLAVDRNASTV